MSELNELITLGQVPIPPGESAGPVQYDPGYEALRTELQKLDSVTQEKVNWSQVVDTSTEILKNRSKHLLVAAYLALGLLEKHDYAGLAVGLEICRDLLTKFWESMEPPLARKRGRIEAIVWLGERGGKAAEARKPRGDEKEPLDRCAALLSEIQQALNERLGNDAPGLGELERVIKQHIAEAVAAAKGAEAKRAQAAKIAAGEIDAQTTPDDARRILIKVSGSVRQACEILRKAAPTDPLPYRLARAITWSQVKDLPPNTKGTTQIPAPPADVVARLGDLHSKGDWGALLDTAETAFANNPIWLDLQRWVAQSLGGLGSAYDPARNAVTGELAMLLTRLPDLTELTFANGTPLAATETCKWIESDVRVHSAPTSGAGTSAITDGLPERLAETARDARKLANRGQLPEAVRLMQGGIAAAGPQRAQFLWRLELARLCLDIGQPVLAVPLLEELENLIERHSLEAWEPALCLAVYGPLLTARRTLLKDARRTTPELVQKTNQLHDRLCRLDPAAALSLEAK
ncbi:MAG: type VI secretion system protein TssA [Candidatus Zixiibacteriota bacterium]